MNRYIRLFIILGCLLTPLNAMAQSIKELQEQTKKSKAKLAETQKLLQQNSKSKKELKNRYLYCQNL